MPALLGILQREAQDQFGIAPKLLKEALRSSLQMDGGFSDSEQLEQLLDRAFPRSDYRHSLGAVPTAAHAASSLCWPGGPRPLAVSRLC
ncbi:hypothetical protein F9C11_20745 [Amycolatopsis sp. VS8301801F10]|uniref:hypothetical protein n=1 Tax=Amycolatopsis sp. VS8301801F10 TaxID=2652442 RepID=UPI0038FC13CF